MSAVRQFLPVRYVRLPELLTELAIARTTGTKGAFGSSGSARTRGLSLLFPSNAKGDAAYR